jgi:peptide/nickel transport system substrate-binding protein
MTGPVRARRWGVMAIVLAWALVAAACSSTQTPETGSATTLVFAASDEPSGFNLNKAESQTPTTRDVAENVFFYAFKADPNYGKVFPGLERPPELVSRDPQVVEWRINQKATWSDGTPVTAQDLLSFKEQVLAPGNLSTEHEGYDQMTDLVAVNDKTVRATFGPPYADYESLWVAVPQARFVKNQPGGFNTGLDESPGPSAGPYMFKEWKRGESITLVRNPNWWGDPKPALESIVLRFITDHEAQVNALANGEVDMIAPNADLSLVQRVRKVADTGRFRSSVTFGPNWDLFTYNVANPVLSDVRVRRALTYALDRDAMLDKVVKPITPDARRLDSFTYMANSPDYQAHGAQYARADPDAARRLLDEAGWVPGKDGIREKAGQRLSLRMTAPSGFPRFEQAAELATAQLKPVGIELRSDNCTVDCVLERATKGDFDVLSAGWLGNISTVSLIKSIFGSTGQSNFGMFKSTRFDDLVNQALSVADAREQAALANQADQVLWDELPGVPLYQAPTLFAVSNRFVGMADNANGDGIFWNSHTWGPKA